MAQAKTFYTYAELAKRNTAALINVYNRIFNTNAWEVFFNPYENRAEMLVELMAEMRTQKANEMLGNVSIATEKYQAMKIVVSEEGMAIVWNEGVKVKSSRQVTSEQMDIIRELRERGWTMAEIAAFVGYSTKVVFEVMKGRYSLEETRWNTSVVEGQKTRKAAPAMQMFTAKKNVNNKVYLPVLDMERPNAAYWMEMGL